MKLTTAMILGVVFPGGLHAQEDVDLLSTRKYSPDLESGVKASQASVVRPRAI